MRKRMAAVMTATMVLFLILGAWTLSQRGFALMAERERERALSEEAAIARAIMLEIGSGSYGETQLCAQTVQQRYGSESLQVILVYRAKPMANAVYPDACAQTLLDSDEKRATLLDAHARVLYVKHQLNAQLTLLCASDAGPIYDFRTRMIREAAVLCAAGALAAAGAADLISRVLAGPLASLAQAAEKLRQGQYDVALPDASKDEVGALVEAFSAMRGAVEEREHALRDESERRQRLLDALAHEMRTPLTAIVAGSQLLEQTALDEKEKNSILETMGREARRLSQMDERLMKLVMLRGAQIDRVPFDVPDMCREALCVFEGVTLEGSGFTMLGDRELMMELVRNLVVNAQRAGGSENVRVITGEGFISVKDTGRGMTREEMERAFEPFYRADKARSRLTGGAGLGLTVCREIAQAHGGCLEMESEVGRGTTVTFRLENHRGKN